ncbi:hypothetical protein YASMINEVIRUS_198 [Yasminevirus sp. GU-2018]|uniref:Uncharacterized protein n=1 Tax=Yasminevirus sp. GU-2018 TaxID=2420051 RepID=A0A5K0U7K1_9VIRU|nr:hypothetical protein YASMINEVIRUS_198 [Yasminevirus sp. GU-2018]
MSQTYPRATFDNIRRNMSAVENARCRNQLFYQVCCAHSHSPLFGFNNQNLSNQTTPPTTAPPTTNSTTDPVTTLILKLPSGTTSDDLNQARLLLVTSLGDNLELDIETLNSLLDGEASGSTTQARITAIHNVLLITPTSVLSTDLATVRALLVTTPGSTLENDILTLNTIIRGSTPRDITQRSIVDSTTQAKLGDLGDATSIFDMIGTNSPTSITSALGNTGSNNSSIAGLLNSTPGSSLYGMLVGSGGLLDKIDGTTTDSGSDNVSDKLTTQIQTLKSSSTQLSTAITDVNSLIGGSSDTNSRVTTLNVTIDGVKSMTGLTSFTFSTTASSSNDVVTIVGNDGTSSQSYSLDVTTVNLGTGTNQTVPISNGGTFTLTCQGTKSITFVNNSGEPITSVQTIADYLAKTYPVGSVLKASTTSKVFAIKNVLGGNKPCLLSCATNIASVIGGNSSDITSQLGDPGTNSTIIGQLGGSTSSVVSAMNALSTKLVGNSNYVSSLYNNIVSMNNDLYSGLSSLPNSATYATIGSITTDGSGGINVGVSNLPGSNGTYNLSGSTISNGISSGSQFTLTNGGDTITLYNTSGSSIRNQLDAMNYLRSMYPQGSKLTTCLTDSISSIKIGLGGNGSSVRDRIAKIDSSLLNAPTGVISADLNSVRGLLVDTPNSTLQSDVETLNTLLNGQSSGSSTVARVGNPVSNSTQSDVSSVIGGSDSDIASRLGDPVAGSSGLSALIKASSASNSNDIDISEFTNATNLHDQLTTFLALCQEGRVIEINSQVSSLADLVSMMKPYSVPA